MFRRRSRPEPDDAGSLEAADASATEETETDAAGAAATGGPWDSDEVPADEQTGEVQSAMLAGEQGALELRAFAAPRGGDLWSEVRPQIAADVAQHGGTATERDGRWGVELVCDMQVVMPDGTQARQASRIVGVNGARWLLRATFLGQPAVEPDGAALWEDALAAVVVHRGSHAMPVGDALPLVLPDDAQRMA
jgi:hypothetical protein